MTHIEQKFEDLTKVMMIGFDGIYSRFDKWDELIHKRFDALDLRFDRIDSNFELLKQGFKDIERRLGIIKKHLVQAKDRTS